MQLLFETFRLNIKLKESRKITLPFTSSKVDRILSFCYNCRDIFCIPAALRKTIMTVRAFV